MIKHVVMWKLKDFAEGSSREQNAKMMKAELEALKVKIPLIRNIEAGINAIPSEAAWDVVLCTEFANEHDLDAYQKHPEHVKIAAFIAKIRESRAVVDYKLE